jgi:hypothetical protein
MLSMAAGGRGQPPDAFKKAPAWQPSAVADVKAQVFAWLAARKPDQGVRAAVEKLWTEVPDDPAGADLLARTAATFALVDRNAAQLAELCSKPKDKPALAKQEWLAAANTPPIVAANMRLLYGRWLAQQGLYDEAGEQLAGLKPADVVAPALLLFYQGVVHHALLEKEKGLAAIDQLLEGAEASPRRYVALARLMQEDLNRLEDDTLDHIARRMNDIRRRLDLGHGGKKVRTVEDGVIESLDKLIKKLEEQQQQSAASQANNIRPSQPAQDSTPMGGKGAGEVTKRHIGSQSGWGDLPPKEREETLQQIGREFPAHYRDVIEQYFRRLATDDGQPGH